MRSPLQSESGQLFGPMILLMLLFAVFLAGFLGWCRAIYWQMRVDMIAEAVAMSCARSEAEMLNTVATLQDAENIFLQKAQVVDVNVAHMQKSLQKDFEAANKALAAYLFGFPGQVGLVAQTIARGNGVQLAVPYPKPGAHLQPVTVYVGYFLKIIPVGFGIYEKAYYTRQWGKNKNTPQPDHQITWGVSKFGIIGTATARVWLDALPDSILNNGGFPREEAPWWGGIGIQCFYPQFNARLVPINGVSDQIVRAALKTI